MAAILIVTILGAPELGKEDDADALEWIFYIVLPNFCFGNAIDSIYANMETLIICGDVDEVFCEGLGAANMTNPCCPSEYFLTEFCRKVKMCCVF
jgi:hypothetical protein